MTAHSTATTLPSQPPASTQGTDEKVTTKSPLDWQSNLQHRLQQVRIVMLNTTLPANIGSAARAMLTMGLTDLVVVAPKYPIDDDSMSHAAGAQSVLQNCQIVDSLDEAISDCQLVFAASSRQRHIPRPVVTPDQAAQLMLSRPNSQTQTAILFGREDRGLTNEELALADYHIQIDANPDYPVLNVASAVQVITSFIYSRFLQHYQSPNSVATPTTSPTLVEAQDMALMQLSLRQVWDCPAINHQQKLSLQTRIIELMYQLQLLEDTQNDKLRDLPSRLSRLLSRLQLDQKEYELLSAVIAKLTLRL
ncbi:RNA methyltransferase [Psychrobacter lutiphocae]|uniref:RNA methyltransferase n=1 Tax=Psychrobacter lutiphocae TaxID=540500 RepID=UPI00036B819C|nr:RNA methyltransferase [Psychrobacter lutiphocae]